MLGTQAELSNFYVHCFCCLFVVRWEISNAKFNLKIKNLIVSVHIEPWMVYRKVQYYIKIHGIPRIRMVILGTSVDLEGFLGNVKFGIFGNC